LESVLTEKFYDVERVEEMDPFAGGLKSKMRAPTGGVGVV
jgi:hypothetical protein